MEPTEMSHRWKIIGAFSIIYIIWGSTYLAIRYTVETLPPFLSSGIRFIISGAILYLWGFLRGQPSATFAQWRSAAIVGLFLMVCGNGALNWSEQHIPSSLASILISTNPFWFVVIESVLEKKWPNIKVVAALIAGFFGVILLSNDLGENNNPLYFTGIIVIMISSIFWAVGSIYSKRADLPKSSILSTAMAMLTGGIFSAIVGLSAGEYQQFSMINLQTKSVIALIYLIIFGSLIAFVAYFWLLRVVSPTKVSTCVYVNCVIAVILGWSVGGEELSTRTILAALIIIGSVIIVTSTKSHNMEHET
ncbi:MAG: EamA family transporter [Planctomycetes bacterium]|nr:EamA family transporter [Planctomycetota bacterium]